VDFQPARVKNMLAAETTQHFLREMRSYKLQILGVCEMRWTGSGRMESEGDTILYSGGRLHERGVGVLFLERILQRHC